MTYQQPDPPYGTAQQPAGGHGQFGAGNVTGAGGEPPLWAPRHGASFGQAVGRFFRKYATFSGRASRSEFWWAYLVVAAVPTILVTIALVYRFSTIQYDTVDFGDGQVYRSPNAPGPLFFVLMALPALWWLATIVPTLALGWRRLHDANLPGALYLIAVFVGIVGIVFGLLPSNPEGARYDRPGAAR
ncbi:DUF805 domain-containing protein [Curtobacterium sp. MCBA15_004]|uniref:DUF805 domain-containing protein n=1 Tax=unclassified Curtobacterium TaxID=257496 RepID=UPI0009F6037C|nr:DUF805 domain-containing protein [Curtobacterium sp. MCBA15_004]WIA95696.1 DUF805 domain-containing protein [Curtobacterium sp. MCBA15_004]